MGKLNINLNDYESRLEKLSKLVDKMSSMDWTVENAVQFCKEQGMQDNGVNVPQLVSLNAVLSNLNNFDYKTIKAKTNICQQQLRNLVAVEFDTYNEAYQNYINNMLPQKSRLFVRYVPEVVI